MGGMQIARRFHEWVKACHMRRDGPSTWSTASSKAGFALAIFAMMVFSTAVGAEEGYKWTGETPINAKSLQPTMTLEPDTDRPGQNLRVFDLKAPDPALCAQACGDDNKCRAYTYVKPGVQGPKARCWLKTGVPAAKPSPCCVSGVKTDQGAAAPPAEIPVFEGRPLATGAMTLEQDTDRPGLNYRSFDLDVPEPKRCQKTCLDDPKCKAWTYVKPGVQGPKARCWLKTGVPAAKPNPCCISGLKTVEPSQGHSNTPMQSKPGPMEASPTQPAPTSEAPTTGSQSAVRPDMWKGMRAKIPPASARQPVRPLNRGELVNLLLKNPRTAPRLNQLASTMGMPAQQMATQSTSGKVITGSPATNPPSGMTKNWDWEAGVRFTPRSKGVTMAVYGVTIIQDTGTEYGLSDMYQHDELFLSGNTDDIRIVFELDMPPGIYVTTVDFQSEMLGPHDDLTHDCRGCGSQSLILPGGVPIKSGTQSALFPVMDKNAVAEGTISTYIGQFQVEKSQSIQHWIMLPQKGNVTGVFRGITFTRL